MSNYYRDNQDIQFYMQHTDFDRIVELKEDDFADKDRYPEAPVDVADAVDNYQRVLDIVGEIAGNFVAPRARSVDEVGAKFDNGEVIYAPGTVESMARLKKADLMGFTLPRRYGGLNMPKTVYTAAIEMISRADASLMTFLACRRSPTPSTSSARRSRRSAFCPGSPPVRSWAPWP